MGELNKLERDGVFLLTILRSFRYRRVCLIKPNEKRTRSIQKKKIKRTSKITIN